MTAFKTFTASLIFAAISGGAAVAGDAIPPGSDGFTKYGDVQGWTVFVDNERGSCLIERVDEQKNVVQMGLTKSHELGYLGVFSMGDTGVDSGGKEKIYIDIDGNQYWSDAHRMKSGSITEGYTGGYILANNPDFISDVAKKQTMTVFPNEEAAFTVDLTGTYKAMEMARACNSEQSS